VTELSEQDRLELISRLRALHELAGELSEAFDDAEPRRGATEVLRSIERMLAILGAGPARD
jgi:hypothetical protein